MDIRTLRYFLTVAREENMTTAADILHVTQPTLSRQIADLEEELGCKLFTRTNRATYLTEKGMQLRRRAEEIVSMMDRTEMEFMSSDLEVHGDIHIGAGETRLVSYVTDAMVRLKNLHPDIRFHIYSGIADDVTERLDHGVLDFALLFEPVNTEKYEFIPFTEKDIPGLLVRSDSPLAQLEVIKPSDLADIPLIISSRQSASVSSIAKMTGVPEKHLNIVGSGNLIYNISLMVKSGLGSALTIDGIIDTGKVSSLRFIPLEDPVYPTLIFAWKKFQTQSPAVSLFLEEIKKALQIT